MFGKIIKAFSVIGPGIFAIGYTIGTESLGPDPEKTSFLTG